MKKTLILRRWVGTRSFSQCVNMRLPAEAMAEMNRNRLGERIVTIDALQPVKRTLREVIDPSKRISRSPLEPATSVTFCRKRSMVWKMLSGRVSIISLELASSSSLVEKRGG